MSEQEKNMKAEDVPDAWFEAADVAESDALCRNHTHAGVLRAIIAAVAPVIQAAERERTARDYNELREAHDAKGAEIVRLHAQVGRLRNALSSTGQTFSGVTPRLPPASTD